jgi:hypothetical protein
MLELLLFKWSLVVTAMGKLVFLCLKPLSLGLDHALPEEGRDGGRVESPGVGQTLPHDCTGAMLALRGGGGGPCGPTLLRCSFLSSFGLPLCRIQNTPLLLVS